MSKNVMMWHPHGTLQKKMNPTILEILMKFSMYAIIRKKNIKEPPN